MTEKELEHIRDILKWYEWTDGCEREEPAYEMYLILKGIYNKNMQKKNSKLTNNEKK